MRIPFRLVKVASKSADLRKSWMFMGQVCRQTRPESRSIFITRADGGQATEPLETGVDLTDGTP